MIRPQCLALLSCLFLAAGVCNAAIVISRVSSGTDDAEEHLTELNAIDLTSTDLELGAEGGGSDIQEIGIRFQNLNIPFGSIIQNASIQFTVDETDTEVTSVRIFGELSPNPAAYSDIAGNITSRTKTTIFVDWNNIPVWDTVGAAGADQRTPDLTSIVQEIVNQPGWTLNSAMAFMITANPGGERTAASFNGDPSAAPLLSVTFVPEPSGLLYVAGICLAFAVRTRRRSLQPVLA